MKHPFSEQDLLKSVDGTFLRNSGYLKTVLYSELQPILIENVIILTLVETRRREVVQVWNIM